MARAARSASAGPGHLRDDHAGGAGVEHPAGLNGAVGDADDDGRVRVGGLDLGARRSLVAGSVLEVDDHDVEAAHRRHLGAHRRPEVEERGRHRLPPPQPLA